MITFIIIYLFLYLCNIFAAIYFHTSVEKSDLMFSDLIFFLSFSLFIVVIPFIIIAEFCSDYDFKIIGKK